MRWQLLVRPNCYLCAQAVEVLARLGIAAERLDVDSRGDWQQEYGALVPVLLDRFSGEEWIYPFDETALQRLVQGQQ